MTKREENIFSMYNAVDSLLTSSSDAVSSIPVLQNAHDEFTNLLSQIEAKNNEYINMTAGKTDDKDDKEETMINSAMRTASALSVYGRINSLPDMTSRNSIAISTFKRMRDNDLLGKAKQIHSDAAGIADQLADYGITPEDLTAFNDAISAYESAMDSKESSFAERSAARQALSELFDDADSVLKDKLDNMMELFANSNSEFYNQYQSARVIKDL
jgi:hypothetical protein